jgi:hypothetical protein
VQSVEETECRRAYDSAVDIYNSSFDRKKTAEEVILQISDMHFLLSLFGRFLIGSVLAGCFKRST